MQVVRIYTGEDGESHLEELDLPYDQMETSERTLVEDADNKKESLLQFNEMQGPVFKMEDDPRITSVGKVLRKYSIDELPQLLSVIKGDMSLVGPRPAGPKEWKKYDW